MSSKVEDGGVSAAPSLEARDYESWGFPACHTPEPSCSAQGGAWWGQQPYSGSERKMECPAAADPWDRAAHVLMPPPLPCLVSFAGSPSTVALGKEASPSTRRAQRRLRPLRQMSRSPQKLLRCCSMSSHSPAFCSSSDADSEQQETAPSRSLPERPLTRCSLGHHDPSDPRSWVPALSQAYIHMKSKDRNGGWHWRTVHFQGSVTRQVQPLWLPS